MEHGQGTVLELGLTLLAMFLRPVMPMLPPYPWFFSFTLHAWAQVISCYTNLELPYPGASHREADNSEQRTINSVS